MAYPHQCRLLVHPASVLEHDTCLMSMVSKSCTPSKGITNPVQPRISKQSSAAVTYCQPNVTTDAPKQRLSIGIIVKGCSRATAAITLHALGNQDLQERIHIQCRPQPGALHEGQQPLLGHWQGCRAIVIVCIAQYIHHALEGQQRPFTALPLLQIVQQKSDDGFKSAQQTCHSLPNMQTEAVVAFICFSC